MQKLKAAVVCLLLVCLNLILSASLTPGQARADSEPVMIQYNGPYAYSGQFVQDLIDLRSQGDRNSISQAAVDFIEGSSPYSNPDRFHSVGEELTNGLLNKLTTIYEAIKTSPLPLKWDNVQTIVIKVFGQDWPTVASFLGSREYEESKDNYWQACIALQICLGYQIHFLDDVIIGLKTGHLLETAANTQSRLTSVQIKRLYDATIILLDSIFPLPN